MTGDVFGLAVESATPIAGLAGRAAPGLPKVRVELGRPLEAPPSGWERLMERRSDRGELLAAFDRGAHGYRMEAAGFGAYEIAADGSRVVVRPPLAAEPWVWQRFLLGQALALVAVLNGLEPLHASAVEIDGRIVAFAGGSGSGKSSIALNLAARGSRLVTDDVLALSCEPPGVRCHPGPGVANIRDSLLQSSARRGQHPFRGVVADSREGVRALVDGGAGGGELALLYFLDRREVHDAVAFAPSLDPFLVLGHTFNVLIRSPERLERQLEVCSRVAAEVPLWRVEAPAGVGARELSACIARHASSLFGP